MNAAGNLHEDFRPAPDGFIANRARQVLAETIDLLEQIVRPDAGRRRCSRPSPTAPSA